MNPKPPWVLIATLITSGVLTGLTQALGNAWPKGAPLVANIVAIVVAIAGIVLAYYQAVNSPAAAVLPSAPVVHPDGTPTGATVVTTSSTEPIVAPHVDTLTPPAGGP